jgi:predicted small metal-binding protein
MKVFRCREASPIYCPFEMRGDTIEKVIEQIIAHCKAAHGLTDETLHPAMVGLWTARIHDESNAS